MGRPKSGQSGGTGAAVRKDFASLLQASEHMVPALLESASQAIVGVDQAGRIVLANARDRKSVV